MLETLLQKLLEFTFGDRLFRVALLMLYGLSALAGLLIITAVLLRAYATISSGSARSGNNAGILFYWPF